MQFMERGQLSASTACTNQFLLMGPITLNAYQIAIETKNFNQIIADEDFCHIQTPPRRYRLDKFLIFKDHLAMQQSAVNRLIRLSDQ